MPSTYCINDHINIESSTYSHQFDDLLMYQFDANVGHIFFIDLILIKCQMF
jgi:hypothetical protein